MKSKATRSPRRAGESAGWGFNKAAAFRPRFVGGGDVDEEDEDDAEEEEEEEEEDDDDDDAKNKDDWLEDGSDHVRMSVYGMMSAAFAAWLVLLILHPYLSRVACAPLRQLRLQYVGCKWPGRGARQQQPRQTTRW